MYSRLRPNNQSHRASVKGHRNVHLKQQENARPNAAVVGVSKLPLSSRFSILTSEQKQPQPAKKANKQTLQQQVHVKLPVKKKNAAPVKVLRQTPKQKAKQQEQHQKQQKQQHQKQKLHQVAQANRTKRQQVVDKRRKGLDQVAQPKQQPQPKKQTKGQQAQPQSAGARGGRGGRGAASRGGRGGRGGRGERGGEKKDNMTGEELDVEMDSYWFEAGKGPDPKAAQLDRQMEQYWAGKPKNESEAAKDETPKEPES